MYAVVITGGKQYKVTKDLIFDAEKLELNVGDKIKLDAIMVGDDNGICVGKDCNAHIIAEVVRNGKGPKINIFKYKAKKNVRKRQGHRQPYTALKVLEIVKA